MTVATAASPSSALDAMARFGYAAKGVVYAVIGILAAMAALRLGGQTGGSQEALTSFLTQPFGKVLLAIVGLGLGGYSVWRLIQAIHDPEHEGTEKGALAKRFGYFLSAMTNGSLCFVAFRLVTAGSAEKSSAPQMVSKAFGIPAGTWFVTFAGLVFVGVGLYQIAKGAGNELKDRMDLSDVGPHRRSWVIGIGRFGTVARGTIFGLIGVYLTRAGWEADAGKAVGVEGALKVLENQSFGTPLMAAVALGLAAYGIYQICQAKFRIIKPL